MLNYFKRMFNKDKSITQTEQFYTPLKIALHSSININSVDMIANGSVLNSSFVQPTGDMEVLAIGTITVSNYPPLYQIYLEDEANEEFVLQLVEGKDFKTGEPTVEEITLFKQVVTLQPETELSLQRALGDIGFPTIMLDNLEYKRLWGDSYTEKMDFRQFKETVITPQGIEEFDNNYILYGREVNSITNDSLTEYLLVGLEENEQSAQIMMQLGVALNINEVSVR